MSSTIGITRIRAALNSVFHKLHTCCKSTLIYSVFCLVVHQRICIFLAETLLMLMMVHPKFSSKPVSIFN